MTEPITREYTKEEIRRLDLLRITQGYLSPEDETRLARAEARLAEMDATGKNSIEPRIPVGGPRVSKTRFANAPVEG